MRAKVPKAYAPEFRRNALNLVAACRPVAQDLEISEQAIYTFSARLYVVVQVRRPRAVIERSGRWRAANASAHVGPHDHG